MIYIIHLLFIFINSMMIYDFMFTCLYDLIFERWDMIWMMVFISSSGIQLSLAESRASSSRRWARWWRPVVAINPLSRLGWQRLFAPVCQKAGEKPAMPWLAKSRIFAPYSKLCQVVSKSMCTRASTSSVQMCWQSVSNSLQTHCLPSSRSWRSNSTKHAWTSSSGFRAQLLAWCQLRRPKTSGWKHLCSRCLPKEWHAWSTWAVPWCQWCVTIQPRRQLWRNVALRSRRPPSCRSFATSSSWSWGIASCKTAPWRLLRSLWEGSKSQSRCWCRPLPSSRQKRVRRSLLLFRPTSFRVLWSLWVTRCLGSCFMEPVRRLHSGLVWASFVSFGWGPQFPSQVIGFRLFWAWVMRNSWQNQVSDFSNCTWVICGWSSDSVPFDM